MMNRRRALLCWRLKRFLWLWLCWSPLTVDSLAAAKARRGGGSGFGATKQEQWKVHDTNTSPSILRLRQFLEENKSSLANVDIGVNRETGQPGLYALKNFKEGQIVCQIPSDLALALSDPAEGGQDAPTMAHGGLNFLNMYWQNKEKRQLWSPYLDTLPTEPDSVTPDMFTDEELHLMEFPRLIQRAKQRRTEVQELSQQAGIPVEDLQFATWIVSTRAFPIAVATEETGGGDIELDDRGQVLLKANEQRQFIRVLVPFLDMANHSSENPNAKMTLIDPQKDNAWFALQATRPIPQGREITIAKGSGFDSTVELFLNQGIVPESNPIDTVMLRKGGDDCLANLEDWSTTLDEDKAMLEMTAEEDANLRKILAFRIRMKEAYPT